MAKRDLTQYDLNQFTGTAEWFRNPLYPWMLYTDGVKYFADNAGNGAYWLLDILGTEFRALAKQHDFIHVKLVVPPAVGTGAEIVADDGNDNVIYRRSIPYTDCPKGEWRFYLEPMDEGVSCLLLPSEH